MKYSFRPFLICKLTNRSVTKAAISLDKHVTGKRFRKAFQRFEGMHEY